MIHEDWFVKMLEDARNNPAYEAEMKFLEITEHLCEIMYKKKISRRELARRLNITTNQVRRYFSGEDEITSEILKNINAALNKPEGK